jgi:hypothetical protein
MVVCTFRDRNGTSDDDTSGNDDAGQWRDDDMDEDKDDVNAFINGTQSKLEQVRPLTSSGLIPVKLN